MRGWPEALKRLNIMKNPIVAKLMNDGKMEFSQGHSEITANFELSEKIREALSAKKMKCEYHFSIEDGKLIFDKVLGRDDNDDFYNAKNGNLESRKQELKEVVVSVLLEEYNKG